MIVNMDMVWLGGSAAGLGITGETGFMRSVCCIVFFLVSVIFVFCSLFWGKALEIAGRHETNEENFMIFFIIIVSFLCLFLNKYSFSKYYGDIYILLPYFLNCLILIVVIHVVVFVLCIALGVINDKKKTRPRLGLAIWSVACIVVTLLYSWIISSNRKLRITAEKIDSLIKLDRIVIEESVDGDYVIYCGTKFNDLYYVNNVSESGGIYMKISLHDGFVDCKLWQNGSEVDRISIGSYVFYGFDSDGNLKTRDDRANNSNNNFNKYSFEENKPMGASEIAEEIGASLFWRAIGFIIGVIILAIWAKFT